MPDRTTPGAMDYEVGARKRLAAAALAQSWKFTFDVANESNCDRQSDYEGDCEAPAPADPGPDERWNRNSKQYEHLIGEIVAEF